MKRILLFVMTNLAVMVVLGIVVSLTGANRFIGANGLNIGTLMVFSLIMGFGGAIISLLISKPVAKWSSGVRVIDQPSNADEAWIVDTVRKFADKAQIGMPEVGIFEGAPNAFATGAFKNSALVAVSTGLLQGMTREEVEAVIGHEVAHIANGDMVTMTLIQGVMNTFVVFLSRVIGYADRQLPEQKLRALWPRHWLLRHHHRAGYRARFCGRHHRGLVQPPARIPRGCGCRPIDGPQATHDECAGPLGWHGAWRVAQEHGGYGYCRWYRSVVLHPPAD